MRWHITENTESECPGFSADLLPDRLPANFHVLVRDGAFYLSADGLAGMMSLKQGNSILIEPKYKRLRPLEMYSYINHLTLEQTAAEVTEGREDSADILTLARQFAAELAAVQCKPKKIRRLPVRQTGTALKGRVDWISSARLQAQGRRESICTTTFLSSNDIPENQLISTAAKTVMSFFEPYTPEWNILQSWASLPYRRSLTAAEIQKLQGQLKNAQFSGAHAFYYRPLILALIILGVDQSGMMTSEGDAVIFHMPDLYENYVRTAFLRRSTKKGFSCQKSFVPRSFLFCSGDCELEPDITIYDGEKIRAVLDVKYKTPDSRDYYQIYTYMKFAGLNQAYLISPAADHRAAVTAYDGSRIVCLRIDSTDHQFLEAAADEVMDAIRMTSL